MSDSAVTEFFSCQTNEKQVDTSFRVHVGPQERSVKSEARESDDSAQESNGRFPRVCLRMTCPRDGLVGRSSGWSTIWMIDSRSTIATNRNTINNTACFYHCWSTLPKDPNAKHMLLVHSGPLLRLTSVAEYFWSVTPSRGVQCISACRVISASSRVLCRLCE